MGYQHLTQERTLALLNEVVAEVGEDYVYTKRAGATATDKVDGVPVQQVCRYVYNGRPDCIVGRILAKAGVPLDRLAKFDCASSASATNVARVLGIRDREVGELLRLVQREQDSGTRWGVIRRRVAGGVRVV